MKRRTFTSIPCAGSLGGGAPPPRKRQTYRIGDPPIRPVGRKGATLTIRHDHVIKFRNTYPTRADAEADLLGVMHRVAPAYSAHHAFKHEGWTYSIEEHGERREKGR